MPDKMDEKLSDDLDYDKAEVQSAKGVISQLTKTAKTLKIYLSNNPIHKKFINELSGKFQVHLEGYGPLRLRIRQFELLCSGQPVYENMNRLESISFKLFVDGLREISFHPGLEKKEIIELLAVLGKTGNGENTDDDMVTLLWEKHLSHIDYLVVDDLKGEVEGVDTGDCKEMQHQKPSGQQLQAVYQSEVISTSDQLSPKGIDVPDLHIFKLTEGEIQSVKRELRWEEEIDTVNELEGMLFDILRMERDPGLFSETLDILDDVFQQLMAKGDFEYARKILEFLWEMLDPETGLDKTLLSLTREALTRAGSAERISQLHSVLNSMSSDQLDAFFPFMILFQKEVIPSVVELLASVQTMKLRRILCDILVELGRVDIETIIENLNDPRWFVVRNLIYVLGKIAGEIGEGQIARALLPLVHHQESKVRKELLHVIDGMKQPTTTRLLVHFISDPDLSNRIFAMKSLSKKGVKAGFTPLLDLSASKEFDAKVLYEKKEITNAIARLGKDEAIPEIRKWLHSRWHIFKNSAKEEKGLCAAAALQRIASPAAIDALREGNTSRNKTIREACRQALLSLENKQK